MNQIKCCKDGKMFIYLHIDTLYVICTTCGNIRLVVEKNLPESEEVGKMRCKEP